MTGFTSPLSQSYMDQEVRRIRRDPEWMACLAEVIGKLEDDFYGSNFQDQWEGTAKFETLKDGKNAGILYLPSGRLPLEVGTTSAAKTYLQLLNGGVARWPYDQKEITVYKLVRDAGPNYGIEGETAA